MTKENKPKHVELNGGKFQIKVQIHQNYSKELPFAHIRSRLPTAVICQYIGNDIGHIFQQLSHRTRSFFVSQKALQGFLPRLYIDFESFLILANEAGSFQSLAGKQIIDVHDLIKHLAELSTKQERKKHVMSHYPGLFISYMKEIDRDQEAYWYMERCKAFREADSEDYSLYVHGFLEPWLRIQRDEGRLVKSTCKLDIQDKQVDYQGEVDVQTGKPCGEGSFTIYDYTRNLFLYISQ